MTELNDLVNDLNAPFLENANSINSRGQIAGKTTVQGTPIADAFLASPSPGEVNSGRNTRAAPRQTSKGQKVRLSEDIRKVLRQRLGLQYHIPGLGAPPRDWLLQIAHSHSLSWWSGFE
jgi:hypothetical protein